MTEDTPTPPPAASDAPSICTIEFLGDGNAVIRFTDDTETLLPADGVAAFIAGHHTAQLGKLAIPIPRGGFTSNEEEARWLEQTLRLRIRETLHAAGINATIAPIGLHELLMLSLDAATRRAAITALEARLADARAQERERCEAAIRQCRTWDTNGYIVTKADAIEAIRSLAAPSATA